MRNQLIVLPAFSSHIVDVFMITRAARIFSFHMAAFCGKSKPLVHCFRELGGLRVVFASSLQYLVNYG
jgi:hypothetical protein